MTPLMMLALTVPPSLAFVIERWLARANAREKQRITDRFDALESRCKQHEQTLDLYGTSDDTHRVRLNNAEAELKRLADQVNILAERRFQ